MSSENIILAAYQRAITRERARSGIMYPIVRANCVRATGRIVTTDVFAPETVARWRRDRNGKVSITLV